MTGKPEIVDLVYFRDDGMDLVDGHHKWYVVKAKMKDGSRYAMNVCASNKLVEDEPMFRAVLASQIIDNVLEAVQ